MMEENNNIFLPGGDALVYNKPMHNKYSTTFVWGHPFSTDVSYDRFFNPQHLYAPVHILDDLPPPPPTPSITLVAYILNGWPIFQPKNK